MALLLKSLLMVASYLPLTGFSSSYESGELSGVRLPEYYAQSNGGAEVVGETAKCLLVNNIQHNGGLDSDKFAWALLQYRNTPLPGLEV